MVRIIGLKVMNTDGVPDNTGDYFSQYSIVMPPAGTKVPVVDHQKGLIGMADVFYQGNGDAIMAHVELANIFTNAKMALLMTPSVVGRITGRRGNQITAGELTDIMLVSSQNADRRILAVGQQQCIVKEQQIDGSWLTVHQGQGGAPVNPILPTAGTSGSYTRKVAATPTLPDIDIDTDMMDRLKASVGFLIKKMKVCAGCPNELSPTMDAYYGKHPDGSKFCSTCQRKRKL